MKQLGRKSTDIAKLDAIQIHQLAETKRKLDLKAPAGLGGNLEESDKFVPPVGMVVALPGDDRNVPVPSRKRSVNYDEVKNADEFIRSHKFEGTIENLGTYMQDRGPVRRKMARVDYTFKYTDDSGDTKSVSILHHISAEDPTVASKIGMLRTMASQASDADFTGLENPLDGVKDFAQEKDITEKMATMRITIGMRARKNLVTLLGDDYQEFVYGA